MCTVHILCALWPVARITTTRKVDYGDAIVIGEYEGVVEKWWRQGKMIQALVNFSLPKPVFGETIIDVAEKKTRSASAKRLNNTCWYGAYAGFDSWLWSSRRTFNRAYSCLNLVELRWPEKVVCSCSGARKLMFPGNSTLGLVVRIRLLDGSRYNWIHNKRLPHKHSRTLSLSFLFPLSLI